MASWVWFKNRNCSHAARAGSGSEASVKAGGDAEDDGRTQEGGAEGYYDPTGSRADAGSGAVTGSARGATAGTRRAHRSLQRVSTSPHVPVEHRLTQPELRITFNDSMTSTYEYPSEQSLLEELPPEPGDFDYIHQLHGRPGHPALPHELSNESDDSEEQLNLKAGGALQSTPGLGSTVPRAEPTEGDKTGGLMSYRSRYMGDYQLGVETKQSSNQQMQPEEKEPVIEESVQITPAEDDDTYNWSNAATSDLLF